MSPTIWYSGKSNALEMVEKAVVPGTWGEERRDEGFEHSPVFDA